MQRILSTHFGDPAARTLAAYEAGGGYQGLRKALALGREGIVAEVVRSHLRGRGGAGFPAARKWSFAPDRAPTVYLVVNADEGEPGCFKDRTLMHWDPHRVVEGTIVVALAVGSHHAYIYVRGELGAEAGFLEAAVAEARQAGYLGDAILGHPWPLEVTVHRGAGAYICGEETALIASLEGARGMPRLKPPFPAVAGAFMQPTIVNNVETVAYVPPILLLGGEAFARLGAGDEGGLRLVAVSGHVERPGVYEVPVGTNLLAIIRDCAGGVPGGHHLKACIPGGSSVPVLTAAECDVPYTIADLGSSPRIREVEVVPGRTLDLGGGRTLRSSPGSAGIVVMDETTDLVRIAARLMAFYAHESCGQCTPCRVGTHQLARMTEALADGGGTPDLLAQIAQVAEATYGRNICPLGDSAAMCMLGFLTKFRPEFEARTGPRTA